MGISLSLSVITKFCDLSAGCLFVSPFAVMGLYLRGMLEHDIHYGLNPNSSSCEENRLQMSLTFVICLPVVCSLYVFSCVNMGLHRRGC